jgi:ketosteroid isomerase-like protein
MRPVVAGKEIIMLHRLTRFVVVAAIAILFMFAGGSSKPPAGGASGGAGEVQKEISELIDQYSQALLAKDEAALDKIWADDLSFINLRGELLTKQNRMENIKTGATAFKSTKVSDKRIRAYGETAVATCRVDLEAQYSGQEGSGGYAVTLVWARPKGTWQMVAVQMTRIEK